MIGTLICSLGGLAIAWAALRPTASARPAARVVLAFAAAPGLGLGLASLTLTAGIALRLPRPNALAFLIVSGVLALAAHRAARSRTLDREPIEQRANPRWRALGALGALAAAGALAFALNVFVQAARAWPTGTWDAVAIWNVRARFLDRAYVEAPEQIARVHPSSHGNYPLLLPGAIAAEYGFEGEESNLVAATTALAYFVGTGLLAIAFCGLQGSWSAGFWAAAFYWGTPIAVKWGAAQVADVPVGYYLLGATGVLATLLPDAPPERRLPPWLGGALLGLLAWTKNEGLLYLAVALAVWGLALFVDPASRRLTLGGAARIGLGALPALGALAWLKVVLPESGLNVFLGGPWSERISDLGRWLRPLGAIAQRFAGDAATVEWSGAWTAVGLALIFAAAAFGLRAVVRSCGFVVAVLVGCALTWLPVYAITPYDQTWHINSSIDRLFLQLYPTALLASVLAFAAPLRAARESSVEVDQGG